MVEMYLEKLKQTYMLSPVDAGDYASFSVAGMDFTAQGYEADGLGRVSVMRASGMGGAMSMESLIISPKAVDAPLFSLDAVSAGRKEMLYLEQYDTLVSAPREEDAFFAIKEAYADLGNQPEKPCWYDEIRYASSAAKAGTDAQKDRFGRLADAYADAYLSVLAQAPSCDLAEKTKRANAYRDGLLANGGPATDAFLKTWGEEKTGEFFREVLFG